MFVSVGRSELVLSCRGVWSAFGGDRSVRAALRRTGGPDSGGAVRKLHQGAGSAGGGLVSAARAEQFGQRTAGSI